MKQEEPKPWHERLLDWLERWRLLTGLVLLAFVIGSGFTLLLMEQLRQPQTVVTETREVVEEKIVEETPSPEPVKVAKIKGAKSETSSNPETQEKSESSNESAIKPNGKVNINTASASQLEGLSGIGPKLAERILEYRTSNGPFKSPEQIINVKGIGPKTFEKFKGEITI